MSDYDNTLSPADLPLLLHDIALVTTAVANGDLSQKITAEATGEMLELKKTINTMVDQLNVFAGEATRIAREIGTEGIFGGQMEVAGVTGTWRDLTDNLNFMSTNLTNQIRYLNHVAQAAINGDSWGRPSPHIKGEMTELRDALTVLIARVEPENAK